MSNNHGSSRRDFIKRSAKLGAACFLGPQIVASGVLAAPGRPGANDRIGIGHIGVGRRARQLMPRLDGAQIVAISDVDKNKLDELTAQNKEWKAYQDYREMLASDEVDAVVIASPDHWHALHTIHACKAGKDVYVEKPMTLTVREGRVMVDVAREYGRIVQAGSQQRSSKECRLGCELVRNGRIGNVHTVHASNYQSPWECDLPAQDVPEGLDWDMWCGPTEPRPYHIELYTPRVRGHEAGWISYRPYSGGEMTGWGAHGLDQIQWALGMDDTGPVEVWPELDKVPAPDGIHKGPTCEVCFRYANGVVVKLDNMGPGGGGVFEGDAGKIMIDRDKCETKPKEIIDEPIKDSDVRLYKSDNHMQNWIDCIRSRELPVADVEIGHRTATMCHLGNIARWTGRHLKWDPEKELFVDDDEANALLDRPRRAPWTLES